MDIKSRLEEIILVNSMLAEINEDKKQELIKDYRIQFLSEKEYPIDTEDIVYREFVNAWLNREHTLGRI